jgi:hypothetical protein
MYGDIENYQMNKVIFTSIFFIFFNFSVNATVDDVSGFVTTLLSKSNDIGIICQKMKINERDDDYESNLNFLKNRIKEFEFVLYDLSKIMYTETNIHISYPLVKILIDKFKEIDNKMPCLILEQNRYPVLDDILLLEMDMMETLCYLKLIIDNYSISDNINWIDVRGGGYVEVHNAGYLAGIIDSIRERFGFIETICIDAVIFNRNINSDDINEIAYEMSELIDLLKREAYEQNLHFFGKILDVVYEKINDINKNICFDGTPDWARKNIRYQSLLLDAFFIELMYSLKFEIGPRANGNKQPGD